MPTVAQSPATSAGGSTLTTSAPAPPSADPTYLEYLRSAGLDESMIQNTLGNRVSAITRAINRKLPQYAEDRADAIRNTGNSFEDRGVFRSGNRLVEQARSARQVDRARDEFLANSQDQIGELYNTSAEDIARLRRQLAEQGITSGQNVALNNANAGVY